MELRDLKADLAQWSGEVDAEMRHMVRQAEASGTIDLDRYRLLGSIETLLIAAEATIAALAELVARKGVTV